jgi:hypothetical protein
LLALLAATAYWVVMANAVRIVLVTWAAARSSVDLASGWRHEALGLALTVLTLGLLASTDRLYQSTAAGLGGAWSRAVAAPWRRWRRRRLRAQKAWESLADDVPAVFPRPAAPAGQPVAPATEPTRWPRPAETVLAGRAAALAYAALAALLLVLFWPALRVALGASAPASAIVTRLGALDAGALPGLDGPFRRIGFNVERRETGSEFGEHSRTWIYAFGPHQALLSVDYLFPGWHELTMCYANGGWTLLRRAGVPGGTVVADLSKGTGDHSTLFFSVIDARGFPLSPGLRRRWYDRLAVWEEPSLRSLWERLRTRGQFYQVQLLVTGGRPLSGAERDRASAFFLEGRARAMRGAGHAGPWVR